MKVSFDAHKNDFDYLLGDWEFTAVNKEWGKSRGYWSAVSLGDGQLMDEFKIVGDKGEVYYSTATLRAYNALRDRWDLVSSDSGGGLQNVGSGKREGDEVRIEQTFGTESGQPTIWRIRYHDIKADRFSWAADVSRDGGKSWTKDYQQIEARRIGPPHGGGAFPMKK